MIWWVGLWTLGRFVEAIRITYDVVPNEKAILGSRGVYSNGSNGSSLDLDSESDQYIVDVKSDQYKPMSMC